jgi:hypothetical protein
MFYESGKTTVTVELYAYQVVPIFIYNYTEIIPKFNMNI